MAKLISIVGARPQFVKAGVVHRALERETEFQHLLVHTGQHFDQNMSGVFFEELELPEPAFNLGISSLTHGAMTGRMIEGIEKILLEEKPAMVILYGDTNSTLAGALAAQKLGIAIAHVEAGLRSYNMAMPEEVNRILTDRISDLLFCPTRQAIDNLNQEGYEHLPAQISFTGDVMYDAVLYYGEKSATEGELLETLGLNERPFVLATIHRQENTDSEANLKSIMQALENLNQDYPVVLPLHPRTKARLEKFDLHPNLIFCDPVGYLDMLLLLKKCALVVTDSGGLQKEAFFSGKRCVVAREQTEWVELTESGYNALVGADGDALVRAAKTFLQESAPATADWYGNGDAGGEIAKAIAAFLSSRGSQA